VRRLPPVGSIQAFVHVVRLGSLKSAAESLALSAPALSRRIQSLEQFLGTSLFDRQHNTVQLNEPGKIFFSQIEPHIDALALAVEGMSERAQGMRIRVAVPSLFAAQRLLPALPELRRLHPELLIDFDTGADRISAIGDRVDAAIAITEGVDERYYSRIVERGRIVAIRSSETPLESVSEPADLSRAHILLHSGMPKAFDAWRHANGMPALRAAQTTYFDAGQLILDAAAEGLGIAFMLESHLTCSTDKRLKRLFSESAESPYAYWFACSRPALERRPVRIFHDWLFDHFHGGNQPA
jgi:LysR family glycine cleavage system transcriptional activator